MGGSVHDARVKNFAMHDAQSFKITMHGARNTGLHFCVLNNKLSISYIPNVAFFMSLYAMIFTPQRNRKGVMFSIQFVCVSVCVFVCVCPMFSC